MAEVLGLNARKVFLLGNEFLRRALLYVIEKKAWKK
jgi:hypothetical protein